MSARRNATAWCSMIFCAERLALLRIGERRLIGRPRHAERLRGDADAPAFEVGRARCDTPRLPARASGRGSAPCPRTRAARCRRRAGRACARAARRDSPAVSVGTIKALMPLRPASGSVTAKTIATCAFCPEVMNCLVPLSTQRLPWRRARVLIAAASEPAPRLGQAEARPASRPPPSASETAASAPRSRSAAPARSRPNCAPTGSSRPRRRRPRSPPAPAHTRHGRRPAPPYSGGTSMPMNPSLPSSASASAGNRASRSHSAACGASRFCAHVARGVAQQALLFAEPHSMTSSARARSAWGMARPSAFAAFRLIARSNRSGNSTGRSPGFAPRSNLAARREICSR